MKSVTFTREARAYLKNQERVKKDALRALGNHEGPIYFLTFQSEGKQFALSTRTVLEVGYFPHRSPVVRIDKPASSRKRKGGAE